MCPSSPTEPSSPLLAYISAADAQSTSHDVDHAPASSSPGTPESISAGNRRSITPDFQSQWRALQWLEAHPNYVPSKKSGLRCLVDRPLTSYRTAAGVGVNAPSTSSGGLGANVDQRKLRFAPITSDIGASDVGAGPSQFSGSLTDAQRTSIDHVTSGLGKQRADSPSKQPSKKMKNMNETSAPIKRKAVCASEIMENNCNEVDINIDVKKKRKVSATVQVKVQSTRSMKLVIEVGSEGIMNEEAQPSL
ncbi:hypothetical protein Agabi119p4_10147 [Agaricus bisporus var. burnettii]|uniref:Uncharacterized protein n=1 Tax=Agaricus bisporus var. burnettii TaxID=192524 RepID=A0A8H7C1Z7_AGABI|nr:hypothetical protein Agabi119p4_10147 [Agaricus bisporus var. burnettii]